MTATVIDDPRRLYRPHTIHRPLQSAEEITPEHLRQYWTEGYLAVENLYSAEEIERYKAGLSHLIAGGNPEFTEIQLEGLAGRDPATVAPAEREPHVRKLLWFARHDARLGHASMHPAVVAIGERLLGERMKLIQDMALLKPAHHGSEKPWHQDTAYFNQSPFDGILGTWAALDPATLGNGCMHVIPGSHLKGPQPHWHVRDCQLDDDVVDVDNVVAVPLRPGGVLFFHGLLHHGTPPNTSADRRRALQFHYAAKSVRDITEAEHAELFHDDAGYSGCRNNFRRPLPRLAERTF